MCAYRVKKANPDRATTRAAFAIMFATFVGLILVGFVSTARADDGTVRGVFFDNCPVDVREGRSFEVQVASDNLSGRMVFYLEFEPGTAGTSDYVARDGLYNTPNPGSLRFATVQDRQGEGDEAFAILLYFTPEQVDSGTTIGCDVNIIDDDTLVVGGPRQALAS